MSIYKLKLQIASDLRNAIITLGRITSHVYQDNGRAFRANFFNGDKKFEELGFTGIYKKLGITPIYAMPYNARAKVIERFFLDMGNVNRKLTRYKHLFDRISGILKFDTFTKNDIAKIIEELSEVELSDCAKSLI